MSDLGWVGRDRDGENMNALRSHLSHENPSAYANNPGWPPV